jgi:hypothetical protein
MQCNAMQCFFSGNFVCSQSGDHPNEDVEERAIDLMKI